MTLSHALRRRLYAALILYAFAIGSALFWNGWRLDGSVIITNLFVASAGIVFLHWRWRRIERRGLTPRRLKDIFS